MDDFSAAAEFSKGWLSRLLWSVSGRRNKQIRSRLPGMVCGCGRACDAQVVLITVCDSLLLL